MAGAFDITPKPYQLRLGMSSVTSPSIYKSLMRGVKGTMRWDRRLCKCGGERDYRAKQCRSCERSTPTKWCSKCEQELPRTSFYARSNGGIVSRCKACCSLITKNKPKKEFRVRKPSEYKKAAARISHRRRTEPLFKMKESLRAGIRALLKKHGGRKSAKTAALLGCSVTEFRSYIEKLWAPGMSWENHGRNKNCWHLDHIKPLQSFDLTDPEQQKLCFHYTNYHPLWALDNIRKGASLNWDLVA